MARLILALVFATAVAACIRFPGLPANETGVLSYDWIPADPRPVPRPLYCYQTLATPECFAQPIPGRQLLGLYGPRPALSTRQPVTDPPPATPPTPVADAPPPAVPIIPVEHAPTPLAPPPKS